MEVLIKPLITEKMSKLGDKLNRFAFVVNNKANKIEIKKAVESFYGVKVDDVNTMRVPAKNKSRFTRTRVITGRKSGYKKAVVTLAPGEVIDFYSEV
jgi:large subunit ribosomal protein L23